MKNLIKNKLKLIATGMFVATMGFGITMNLRVSEITNSITLEMLEKKAEANVEHPQDGTWVGRRPFLGAGSCVIVPGSC